MPITLSYADDNSGVVLDYSAEVTGDHLIETINTVFNDSRFKYLKYWIADRTKCEAFILNKTHVQLISELTIRNFTKNPQLLLALVSPTNFDFGMSRMYEMLIDDNGFKTKVFRNRTDADKWILKELNNSEPT